ncbi:DUF3667 domain-containing protein [Pedobacter sp.]|uniref:DUF3667 domain-containing protein n=1 Tax=Pedobacter sp. TaxID=1411316 RepID=UPI003D7F9831
MSSHKHRKDKNCLNCGHTVEEYFCTHCGQENLELKEDAWHMVIHAISDYFHFESKFFGTLKPLLFQPGTLTQKYVAGKRVSFINPIRLYIFVSIVFFLVTLSSGNHTDEGVVVKENGKSRKGLNIKSNLAESLNLAKDTTIAAYETRQKSLPKSDRDNLVKQYINKKFVKLYNYPNASEKLLEEFVHNIPKLMFILLPFFALILKLVYFKRKKFYYEHLIYSFHVHSALFLSILLFMFLNWLFGFFYNIEETLVGLWTVYIIWYIYRSLRTFYGSSRWKTVFKLFALYICYIFVFVISLFLIFALTAIMT